MNGAIKIHEYQLQLQFDGDHFACGSDCWRLDAALGVSGLESVVHRHPRLELLLRASLTPELLRFQINLGKMTLVSYKNRKSYIDEWISHRDSPVDEEGQLKQQEETSEHSESDLVGKLRRLVVIATAAAVVVVQLSHDGVPHAAQNENAHL